MRKLVARIVAHLAGNLHLPQFPGAIQCVSYLLQDETTLAYSDQQGLTPIVHKGGRSLSHGHISSTCARRLARSFFYMRMCVSDSPVSEQGDTRGDTSWL